MSDRWIVAHEKEPEVTEAGRTSGFAGWMALLARVSAAVTAMLMGWALLIAGHMEPCLTWAIIGSLTTAVVSVLLRQFAYRGGS